MELPREIWPQSRYILLEHKLWGSVVKSMEPLQTLERGLKLDDTLLHRSPSIFPNHVVTDKSFADDIEKKQLLDHWYFKAVPEYSRRKLTQKSDKLPAISGTAATLDEQIGDDYFAGNRLGDSSNSLAWGTECAAQYPDLYRAPGFSWASIDGHVFYPRGARDNLAHCVELPFVPGAKRARLVWTRERRLDQDQRTAWEKDHTRRIIGRQSD